MELLILALIALLPIFPHCRCSRSPSSMFDSCSTTCNDNHIQFPFGAAPGCGHPDFQIQCDNGSERSPTIEINTHHFRILDFNYAERSLGIADEAVFSSYCYLPKVTLNMSSTHFQILPHSTLYLFIYCHNQVRNFSHINCSKDSYLAFSDHGIDANWTNSGCESVSEIPTRVLEPIDYSTRLIPQNYWTVAYSILAKGFGVRWQTDNIYQNLCRSCNSSQGICGYNVTDPNRPFLCHCNKAPSHPLSCFPGISRRRGKTFIIVVGAISGVFIISTIIFIYRRNSRKKRQQQEEQDIRGYMDPLDSAAPSIENFLQAGTPTRYSYRQIKRYTQNFAIKLGQGGFGTVFKGELPNGCTIAVKTLDKSKRCQIQFLNEVATIGRIHHLHLVRLQGYCLEGSKRALIYEFMINGSLEKYIHEDDNNVLNWKQLHSIAMGTARGIAYLHDECRNRILHCDIKPHNVLLDASFSPKVADFGLAKLTDREESHVSLTGFRGTPGYVAPEVWSRSNGPVTDRSDVYSYGMLLMEMVGGRKNFDMRASRSSKFYYPEWAFKQVETGEFRKLRGEDITDDEDEAIAKKLSMLGLWCIQYNPSLRPSMSKVTQMLEGTVDIAIPPQPFPVDTRVQSTASESSSSM